MPLHPRQSPRVAIVGAGVCGIALGVKLRRVGIFSFDIFEAEAGVGGTWRVNTYPGAAVDVPSAVYQYSFNLHHWPRTHGTQPELLEYLENTVRDFGLTSHLHLNTRVTGVRWDEGTHQYLVDVAGEQRRYDVVVAATGFLSDPNLPTWPGLDSFRGPWFHTQHWDHDVDLTGKRVAVVGVGSSAAQIVPAIAPTAKQVIVFQREPGWVLPKNARDYSPSEFAQRENVWRRRIERHRIALHIERTMLTQQVYVPGSKRNRAAEAVARSYIDTVFKDRPDLRAAVTPTYAFSGKRRVQSDDYYASLLRENVELVPRAVTSVTPTGVIDSGEVEHEVDILVTATGFTAWKYLSRLEVVGRNGVDIQDTWRDGAFALSGLTVPGYPNFYIMYGPNTNGSGVISINSLAEHQAGWIIRELRRRMRHGYTAMDTRPQVVAAYNRWLQRRLRRTAWAQSNNYMKAPSGRIVTQFHGPVSLYWTLLQALRPIATYGERLDD